MSRFLLAVWSFETHVDPNLALAEALRKKGHEVAFYAGCRAGAEAMALGFEVWPFDALSEELADLHVEGILRERRRPRFLRRHWFDFLLSQVTAQMEDLERIVAEWRPDAIVSDMAMLAPFAILQERLQLPVAVLSHVGYCMVPGPQGPIPGRAMPPRRTALGRARGWLNSAAVNFVMREVPRAIDELRTVYGLKKVGLRITEFHARTLLLIPSAAELDYNRTDLPPTVQYVGMCLWPPLKQHETIRTVKPFIVVDEGTFFTPDPFLLRVAAAALAGASFEVRLIAGKHREQKSLTFGPLASNISLGPWCALDELLGAAALVITSGNTESVLSALSRGTPLIVVPAILDQTEIAWRVQEFGAGIFIPERHCSEERLLKTIHQVLDDSRFANRAAAALEALSKYRGPDRAVELLEELVLR